VLTKTQIDAPGHSAPHYLAARVLLSKQPILTWLELWHVLRWYAHNRGYDGNSQWARNEINTGDTDKEKAALELMKKHGTEGCSMAETICAALGVNPLSDKQSSAKPFKTLNAAFPRKIVQHEVLDILNIHLGQLPKLNRDFINTLIAPESNFERDAWKTIPVPNINLPKRYAGGLLFGQLIPRFDNRIIARCPISGNKVPNKATSEFLNYRWAMILANLRIEGQPLSVEQRQFLNNKMMAKGRLTATELGQLMAQFSGSKNNNTKSYFELHPDASDALILDPALALFNEEGTGSKNLKPFWHCLPEIIRNRALGRWKKRRIVDLHWMQTQCASDPKARENLTSAIDIAFSIDQKKKKPIYLTRDHFLTQSFAPAGLSGRAPYSRTVMKETVDFVLSTNRHPTEASTDSLKAGPLYRSKAVISEERKVPIPHLTNNHLIRQRIDLLLRLVDDIIEEYAQGDCRLVTDIVVEVASDLQTFSGLTKQDMDKELAKRLSHFKSAVKKLEEDAPDLPLTGSLIRKCRIAMDMDWKCPFTGKQYEVHQLPNMERAHIIPYADRPTNSLDAIVLTFPWVNHLQGKRTSMAFINEMANDQRFLTPNKYKNYINGLKIAKKSTHPEDYRRQLNRQKLMLLERYDSKEQGFTQGSLTQTSHLNRLSAGQLHKKFLDPISGDSTVNIHTIPGQVTAETRKAWRLLGTLSMACPEVVDQNGETKNKTEIRSITHLHHALDAVVLGLTHSYLPGFISGHMFNNKGSIWNAMLKRNKNEAELSLLLQTGMFTKCTQNGENNSTNCYEVRLNDIPKAVKQQVAERLAEKRVVQHIPADQSDYDLEETSWRYLCDYEGQAVILQKISRDLLISKNSGDFEGWGNLPTSKETQALLAVKAIRETLIKYNINIKLIERGLLKITTEPYRSLIGLKEGKLNALKSVKIIKQNTNYGITLGISPKLIPFHNVPSQLQIIRAENGGKSPDIIRKGTYISVRSGTWKGAWRVTSVKQSKAYGLSVDLVFPHMVSKGKGNAKIFNMLEDGLRIHRNNLIGIYINV